MAQRIRKLKEYGFLFSELVKRDFKKKYKRTVLGMLWSVLSPLLTLFVMRLIFTNFFGAGIEHYTTFLFCGNIVFSYFSDSANTGMTSLMANAPIFTRINVPKYLFLFSQNVSAFINFGLTFLVFLIFALLDGVVFTPLFFLLPFPILCLAVFNIGIGLILSAFFVFFRDVQYLWNIFSMLLMYLSAIFYDPSRFGAYEKLFLCNPVYVYIRYFRQIVLAGEIPSLRYHLLAAAYALAAFAIGALLYKKKNHRFLYYV